MSCITSEAGQPGRESDHPVERGVEGRERRGRPRHRERVHPEERARVHGEQPDERQRRERGVARHQRAADRPADGGPRAAAVDVPAATRKIDRYRGAVEDEEGRGGDEARRPRARHEERAGRGHLHRDHEGRGERHEPRGQEAILGERRPEAVEVAQLVARGDEEEERERRPQRGVDDGVHC